MTAPDLDELDAGLDLDAEPGDLDDDEDEDDSSPRRSVATKLVELAVGRYELGVTPDGDPYALPRSGPRIVRLLRGGRGSLRAELAQSYYTATGSVASQSALADACQVLDGMAQQVDPVPLHIRVAADGGRLVLDLGDATGRAALIDPSGWKITDQPPVRFRRSALTAALPEPQHGGSMAELWSAVNVTERYRPVLAAVLVAALMPDLPHPVLLLTGEQGTGKSTASARLAAVLDPSPAQLRKPPRDLETWTTAAAGSWVVALDNLSAVPDWLSDALCRASTGDGDVRRRLYTDGDLHVVAFRRVVAVNGIDLGALRGDLAERAVHVELARIPDNRRRLDQELTVEWLDAHPRVLGAVLDLTAQVLAELPRVDLDALPRMADYARVLAAVDRVLGTDGLKTYLNLHTEMASDAATSDPVLIALAAAVPATWEGTSADLLDLLRPHHDGWRVGSGWPASARDLTSALRRHAPTLRRLGWTVTELGRDATRAKVIRWRVVAPAMPTDREGA